MDASISNNFILIFFIIVKNYQKVKKPETEIAESIRRFIYSEITSLHFFKQSGISPICVRIASEQYGHKAYPQQKPFWNNIYLQSVNMAQKIYFRIVSIRTSKKYIKMNILFFVKITISKVKTITRLPL